MENRYADLFRIIFTLNCLILFLSFTGVKSAPVNTSSIIDVMKNDLKLCPISKFVYDSNYTKPCAFIAFPNASWNYNSETLNSFLCLGVYDTAYKICQYSSQKEIFLNSTATFDSYVEKYIPNENKMAQENFCNSLQGFTSLYDKIDSLLKQLILSLNKSYECVRICFDFRYKFQPLCAVFAWIKSINDDMMRSEKKETKHDLVVSDKSHISQSKDEVTSKGVKTTSIESKKIEIKKSKEQVMSEGVKTTSIESKKIEIKESKGQNRSQITADSNNNNNVKESNLLTNVIKSDEEKKSDIEKTNNIQKKSNISETPTYKSVSPKFKDKENDIVTELSTNAEVAKPIKENPPNGDSQIPKSNAQNINKKIINEKNSQKPNKEQNIDDVKPSTLSENTQDHYDAVNPEENMENDIDDVDDTIQHPDTGNQNENVQEVPEQNNVRLTEYSNIRTEDDSHFFTYFTVITLACLAGYIGYHNKQKILAIVLEGRRSRSNRGRRRPSTASYRKLDCTLEEAVTSQCNANVTHVIY